MALLLMICTWIYESRAQQAAVAQIHSLGGSVTYDFQRGNPGRGNSLRALMRRQFGAEYFGNVTRVSLARTKITDDDLRKLAGCSRLRSLELRNTNISGTGFAHLSNLRHLESVDLQRTPLTRKGLVELRTLKSVRSLNLWGIKVTEELVEELEKFRQLRLLEWDIAWGDRRPYAIRLNKKFPDLLIYSP